MSRGPDPSSPVEPMHLVEQLHKLTCLKTCIRCATVLRDAVVVVALESVACGARGRGGGHEQAAGEQVATHQLARWHQCPCERRDCFKEGF